MSNLIKNSHFVQLFVLKIVLNAFIIRNVESNTVKDLRFQSFIKYLYPLQAFIHTMNRV